VTPAATTATALALVVLRLLLLLLRVAVRRKSDGQELERAGVAYLLQKTGTGWQFATAVIHDAEDALRPEWV
jgi:hypothetical protein